MIGHELQLSETNQRGWVGICQCGWVGNVWPVLTESDYKTQRVRYLVELTKGCAQDEHAQHCERKRAEISERSFAALSSNAAYLRTVAPVIRHTGRWGRG